MHVYEEGAAADHLEQVRPARSGLAATTTAPAADQAPLRTTDNRPAAPRKADDGGAGEKAARRHRDRLHRSRAQRGERPPAPMRPWRSGRGDLSRERVLAGRHEHRVDFLGLALRPLDRHILRALAPRHGSESNSPSRHRRRKADAAPGIPSREPAQQTRQGLLF